MPPSRSRSGDLRVEGVDRMLALGRALEAAGRGDLVREMQRGLRQGAKILTPLTRAEARRRLPQRGGLAERVARTPQPTSARIGSRGASVTIRIGKRGSGARAAELGKVRHPVFGSSRFVSQNVQPGWFSDVAKAKRNDVRHEVLAVLDDYNERLIRGI